MKPLSLHQAALLVVDAQQGFTDLCPKELPVPGGRDIVPRVNELLDMSWARIDASQDWHPVDHRSFLGQKDSLYPVHCVQGTPGAEFLPGLNTHRFHAIWRKGHDPDFEAYALTVQHPGYVDLLRGSGIHAVVVCGLAANICCFFAARDLRRAGFRVQLIEDASAGVDIPAAGLDQDQAKQEGLECGIEYVSVKQLKANSF
jgi:nicotinamidase/pyrazinamidase